MEKIPIRTIRSIPKAPEVYKNFSIREVGDLLAGKDMAQPLHRHDFFFLLAIKKGAGTHAIDFASYEAGDNTVFLMRPGQVHQLSLKAGSMGYVMQFGPDFYAPHDQAARQLMRKASSRNHYQFDAHQFQKLHSILTCIFQEYAEQRERYQAVIQANLGIAFIELVRHCSQCSENQANPYQQERLEEFMDLLETHIFTHKQVAHYADRMHLSPYQLNAITKATLGKTSSELINEYVLLEAKRYLLATAHPVNQIADRLGYEDISYFIRFFKKHTGYSPEAFRHNFR